MTKVSILDTGYTWDWLNTLNHFLGGLSWGAGLVLALILFSLYVSRCSKKNDKKEEKEEKLNIETGRDLSIDIKNAHTLADFVHKSGELAPIDALHAAIDRLAEAAQRAEK